MDSQYRLLEPTDYMVILLYVAVLLALGFWVSFRQKDSDDLFLAGRSLGWKSIGLSMWGTNVNPSMLISTAGLAFSTGIVGGNFSWLAFLMLLMLAFVFFPYYLKTGVDTIPGFLQKRFGKRTQLIYSYYTIFTILISWLGGTLYAGGLLMSQIMEWPLWLSVVCLVVIATSFTMLGGLAAVVATDAFQMVMLIIVSAGLVIAGLVSIGGISPLISEVPESYWHLFQRGEDAAYPWYALLLGYPVLGIWFWCTDQTIVQRVLGAKNMKEAQKGLLLTAWLKILDNFLFILPGVICFILFPTLNDPDATYITLVNHIVPVGFTGLIVAVLMAALISTVDSGLNSLSTVFTLDLYKERINPEATPKQLRKVGQQVTFVAAVASIAITLGISQIRNLDLFSLLQAIIGFIAPPVAALFVLAVTWKKVTALAADITLVFGGVLSIGLGVCFFLEFPSSDFWPHFLLLSFYLFAGLLLLLITLSFVTQEREEKTDFPELSEVWQAYGITLKKAVPWWAGLVAVMIVLYIIFN